MMEQIAAGKGRGPKRFMAAGAKAADPSAIWHSNKSKETKRPSRTVAKLQATTLARKSSKPMAKEMPRFVAPQLCKA
jgi:bifunctional non-homologous end joining protein LigD